MGLLLEKEIQHCSHPPQGHQKSQVQGDVGQSFATQRSGSEGLYGPHTCSGQWPGGCAQVGRELGLPTPAAWDDRCHRLQAQPVLPSSVGSKELQKNHSERDLTQHPASHTPEAPPHPTASSDMVQPGSDLAKTRSKLAMFASPHLTPLSWTHLHHVRQRGKCCKCRY